MIAPFIKVRLAEKDGGYHTAVIKTAHISRVEPGSDYTSIWLLDYTVPLYSVDKFEDIVRMLEPADLIRLDESGLIDLTERYNEVFKEYHDKHPGVTEENFIYKFSNQLDQDIERKYYNVKWDAKSVAYVTYCSENNIRCWDYIPIPNDRK